MLNCMNEANSFVQDVYLDLPPPEESGWLKNTGGTHIFDWDCPAHQLQAEVQETIDFLTKGCSCTKGSKNKQTVWVQEERQ